MPGEADRHDVEIGVKSDDRPFCRSDRLRLHREMIIAGFGAAVIAALERE